MNHGLVQAAGALGILAAIGAFGCDNSPSTLGNSSTTGGGASTGDGASAGTSMGGNSQGGDPSSGGNPSTGGSGNTGNTGEGLVGDPAPMAMLPDANLNSPTSGQQVGVGTFPGEVTAWFFGQST